MAALTRAVTLRLLRPDSSAMVVVLVAAQELEPPTGPLAVAVQVATLVLEVMEPISVQILRLPAPEAVEAVAAV